MRITIVTATLRYAAEARGAWRSIEVGAEAALTNSEEDWRAAQTELYHQLAQQLKTLWNNGANRERQDHTEPAAPAATMSKQKKAMATPSQSTEGE